MTVADSAPAAAQQQGASSTQAMLERAQRLSKVAARCELRIVTIDACNSRAALGATIMHALEDIREIGAELQAQIAELGGAA